MNQKVSAPMLLASAARLVEQALEQLDRREITACDNCGRRRFANQEHMRIFENLDPLPMRLRSAAKKLGGDGTSPLRIKFADESGDDAATGDER